MSEKKKKEQHWEYKIPSTLKVVVQDEKTKEEKEMEVPALIHGTLKLKVLLGSERMEKFREVQFKIDEKGEYIKRPGIEMLPKLVGLAEELIVSVDAVHAESGAEYKTMEDLSYDEDGLKILTHVGGLLLNGIKTGKK